MAAPRRHDDTEVIRLISRRLGLEEAAVRNQMDVLADAILTALATHHSVSVKDFLSFSLHETKIRQQKNSRTGQIQIIPAGRSVHVSADPAFQEKAKRKLETIVAVRVGDSELMKTTARYLSLASYSVAEVPTFERARDFLSAKPVSAILVGPGWAPKEVFTLARHVREHPTNGMASILVVGSEPPHRGLDAGLVVLPNAWLDPALTPDEIFARVESELEQIADSRGYFQKQVAFDIPSTPDAVQTAIDFLDQLLLKLAFDEEERFKLVTAFREAIENALRHGNKRDPDLLIHGEFLVDLEKLTLSIRDEGPGFDSQAFMEAESRGTTVETARENIARGKTGGLGIKLLQECVDEIEYLPPGNVLVLTKRLAAKPSQTPAASSADAQPSSEP